MIYSIFKLLQPMFPKDTYITWDNLYEKNAEPTDGWTLFQYLQKNGYRSKYVIRRDSEFYQKLKQQKNTKDIVVIKNSDRSVFFRLFWTLLRAKAVIKPFLYSFSDSFSDEELKKNKYIHDVYVNHGVTYLKYCAYDMYHPGLSNTMIISNDYEKEIYHKAGWPYERMLKGGMCRWDALKKENSDIKTLLIFFTWRGSMDTELFETNRKNNPDYHPIKSTYVSGIRRFLTDPQLHEICQKYNIKINLGIHHAVIDKANISSFSFYAPNVNLISLQDVSKYIREADIFITDRSSMIFDAMFLDTPVLFYTPDKNNLMLNKYENWEEVNSIKLQKETMYNYCETVDDVVNQIKKYAQSNYRLEAKNKQINKTFFYYKKDICKKIVNFIERNKGS